MTDSIFESIRRLLSWSGQQKTNVLASLRLAYIRQLLGRKSAQLELAHLVYVERTLRGPTGMYEYVSVNHERMKYFPRSVHYTILHQHRTCIGVYIKCPVHVISCEKVNTWIIVHMYRK